MNTCMYCGLTGDRETFNTTNICKKCTQEKKEKEINRKIYV